MSTTSTHVVGALHFLGHAAIYHIANMRRKLLESRDVRQQDRARNMCIGGSLPCGSKQSRCRCQDTGFLLVTWSRNWLANNPINALKMPSLSKTGGQPSRPLTVSRIYGPHRGSGTQLLRPPNALLRVQQAICNPDLLSLLSFHPSIQTTTRTRAGHSRENQS